MYAGRIVEEGTLDEIFYDPQHPYTWGLLGLAHPARPAAAAAGCRRSPGQPPSLIAPPEGCHFRPRCPHAFDQCTEVPPLEARRRRRRATSTAAGSTPSRSGRCAWSRRRDRARGAGRVSEAAPSRRLERARRPAGRAAARGRPPRQALPDQGGGPVRPRGRRGAGGRRRQLRRQRGRDAGPGRRVGLRQVDAVPDDPAADRADLGLGPLRGPGDRPASARASCARCAARCR